LPSRAARLIRLGVARSIPRSGYISPTVASVLWNVLSVSQEDGASVASDTIEKLLGRAAD